MTSEQIIAKLPYQHPFLFVDQLTKVSEQKVEGNYTFPEDSWFYQGHFKNAPVTPGVLLTECMAQIGVVCLGIYLLSQQQQIELDSTNNSAGIALSSSEIQFYLPVFPGDKITVQSEKEYYRFHKLKCRVQMYNAAQKLVCQGTIAGMLKSVKHES